MEPREFLEGAVVVGTAVVATIVAGPVGGLLAGAGAGTVVHYLKKQQEEQSQQTIRGKEHRQDNSNPPSTTQTQRQQRTNPREESRQYNPNPPSPRVQAPPTQRITKQFLVLVVSSSQADFLQSLEAKGRIDTNDGETLYDMTKYLWLGSESEFQSKIANISQYSVSPGQESEYDICLVYIELNQADERFKSNVNQLDRYDAFRNLADLEVKFKISPRLQMEAYGNFEVYNR
ncbi:MAG: hypothetical protein U7123_05765 [Potamolinea sp.]